MNAPHHTRSTIRVKFPHGYILQGTFGALETVQDVINYVKENLEQPTRKFYLYETPPKRILDEKVMKNTLIKSKMVPSCMLYFGWTDLSETKPENGPFLAMGRLKEYIQEIKLNLPAEKKEEEKGENDD